ncbi:MAG: molecular chaperone DnaJ [Abditibacteriota bacterium]|nr:molecular chaperone DnaJ [Abditibacteriota bacterium]
MATDYYEILGVTPETELGVIKERYRRLVRENHPDVAADKTVAHERMQLILTAWNVLSDPGLRARYDLSRREALGRDALLQTTSPASSPAGSPPRPTAPNPFYTQPKSPADAEADAKKRARAQQAMRGSAAPQRAGNARTRLLTMVFDAAQLYHVEGRAEEAIRVCNNVMKADPTNAEAVVLLGDIYAEQNRKDVALAMYERAVRLQPNNLLYRQKWNKLRHGEEPATEPAATRSGVANPWAKTNRKSLSERLAEAPNRADSTASAPTKPLRPEAPPSGDAAVCPEGDAATTPVTGTPVAATSAPDAPANDGPLSAASVDVKSEEKAPLLNRFKLPWKR